MTYEYPEEVVLDRAKAHKEQLEELDHARKENMALQEMLAHAIVALGGPLRIKKESLMSGKFAGRRIDISEDVAKDQFVIGLVADE